MINTIINKIKSIKLTKINLFIVALVILVVFIGVMILESYFSIADKQAEYDVVLAQYNEQLMQNDEMEALLEISDDDYIERVARERLDMVYPGEQVYINSAGN